MVTRDMINSRRYRVSGHEVCFIKSHGWANDCVIIRRSEAERKHSLEQRCDSLEQRCDSLEKRCRFT